MADLKFSNITRPTSAPAVGGGFMGSPLNVNVTNEPAPSADLSAPEAVGGWADIAKKADKSRKWAKAEKIVNSVLSGLGALANLGAGAISMVSKGEYPFIPIGNAFAAGGDVFGDLSKNNINNFNEYNAAMGLQSEGISPQEAAQMANAGVAANVLKSRLTEKDTQPSTQKEVIKEAYRLFPNDPTARLNFILDAQRKGSGGGGNTSINLKFMQPDPALVGKGVAANVDPAQQRLQNAEERLAEYKMAAANMGITDRVAEAVSMGGSIDAMVRAAQKDVNDARAALEAAATHVTNEGKTGVGNRSSQSARTEGVIVVKDKTTGQRVQIPASTNLSKYPHLVEE